MDLQTRRDARSLDHGTLEEMRRLAVRRVKAGESQKSVAESLEVHPRTVSKWYTAERKAGPEALASTKSSGRPPGLTAEERAVLLGLIVGKTPLQLAFGTALWSVPVVLDVISSTPAAPPFFTTRACAFTRFYRRSIPSTHTCET